MGGRQRQHLTPHLLRPARAPSNLESPPVACTTNLQHDCVRRVLLERKTVTEDELRVRLRPVVIEQLIAGRGCAVQNKVYCELGGRVGGCVVRDDPRDRRSACMVK